MTAMAKKKWERLAYIDLLAGPGRDANRETGEDFEGSPLIALNVQPPFHKLYLGDVNARHVQTLRRRIPAEDLARRVDLQVGDCHERVKKVVRDLSRGTLGLAFVDPEGFEVRFELFRELARAQVDILFLFPTGGVARNLRLFAVREHSPMDGLIEDWRNLPVAKRAAGKRLTSADEAKLQRSMVGEFQKRMAFWGFTYHDRDDPALKNEKRAIMCSSRRPPRHLRPEERRDQNEGGMSP
ncbi:MAG: three-Cys-motif partner protein TcmP, partial [Chloroflexota bacterium]